MMESLAELHALLGELPFSVWLAFGALYGVFRYYQGRMIGRRDGKELGRQEEIAYYKPRLAEAHFKLDVALDRVRELERKAREGAS